MPWLWVVVCSGQKGFCVVFFFSWYTNGKMFSENIFQLTLMPPRLTAAHNSVTMVSALT